MPRILRGKHTVMKLQSERFNFYSFSVSAFVRISGAGKRGIMLKAEFLRKILKDIPENMQKYNSYWYDIFQINRWLTTDQTTYVMGTATNQQICKYSYNFFKIYILLLVILFCNSFF